MGHVHMDLTSSAECSRTCSMCAVGPTVPRLHAMGLRGMCMQVWGQGLGCEGQPEHIANHFQAQDWDGGIAHKMLMIAVLDHLCIVAAKLHVGPSTARAHALLALDQGAVQDEHIALKDGHPSVCLLNGPL